MIRAIGFSDSNNYIDGNGAPLWALLGLSRFNIFIGENNSGKSRFVRRIINEKECLLIPGDADDTSGYISSCLRGIQATCESINSSRDMANIDLNFSEAYKKLRAGDGYGLFELVYGPIMNWLNLDSVKNNVKNRAKGFRDDIIRGLRNLELSLAEGAQPSMVGKSSINILNGKCFYIPVLRGIENFDAYFNKDILKPVNEALLNRDQWRAVDEYAKSSGHIYEDKINKTYTVDKKFIFTAENLYEDVKSKLLGDEDERSQIKEFQDFISNMFYGGEVFTIYPRERKNSSGSYLAVKIGTSKERAIYDLGDGIKQMITILYKIFEYRNKEAVFIIEEPELNLHPGLQKRLIEILKNKIFEKHQFFIVTHSNHVLESFVGVDFSSIYKVKNISRHNNKFQIIRTDDHDFEILDLLGVSNMSVMMSNSLIFVEGLSDKIIIQKYLEVYFAEKKLDYQEGLYSFAETGGGNIAHWNFIKKYSDRDIETIKVSDYSRNSFVICDGDGKGKRGRKEKIEAMVGKENFFELPVREIENTISRSVLEKALFGASEPKIKKQYEENSEKNGYYNQRYIGKFIDSHYALDKKMAVGSGTIGDKINFALKMASNIHSYGDLSDSAKLLCDKIADFIARSNP